MCLTVVGLSVARGSLEGCRGRRGSKGGEGGKWPYGGDGHNVAAATQGTSPLYPLASHNADADNIFQWCFQTGLLSHLGN